MVTSARPSRLLLTAVVCLAVVPARAQQQDLRNPALDGYVTRIVSSTSFELDGRPVELAIKDSPCAVPELLPPQNLAALEPGDHLEVWGRTDKRSGAIRADQVCDLGWRKQTIEGFVVVDAVERDGRGQVVAVRGAGRLLQLTPRTVVHQDPPLRPLAQAAASDWMSYKAIRQPDGSIAAMELGVGPNIVSERERKLREHPLPEFTPPDLSSGRAGTVRFSHLEKQHPLPADAALAERLTRVGNSVVPAYQRALAAGDPARIDLHFYPVGESKLQGCLSVPGGLVFVPTSVTERLPHDEQLAAVLATCVADILEKQTFLDLPQSEIAAAVSWGSLGVGAFVPGIGLAGLGSAAYATHLHTLRVEQSARVSLDYLEAAGYDPAQAPAVWQILSEKHGTPKPAAPLASTSRYVYEALAKRTRNQRKGTAPPAPGSSGGLADVPPRSDSIL